jgi:hypothetical protein
MARTVAEIAGQTFRDWWLNEYMISNQTLLHTNPKTGDPQPIGLGWLDDAMTPTGPTESDTNYVDDTLGNRTNQSVRARYALHESDLTDCLWTAGAAATILCTHSTLDATPRFCACACLRAGGPSRHGGAGGCL